MSLLIAFVSTSHTLLFPNVLLAGPFLFRNVVEMVVVWVGGLVGFGGLMC